MNKLSEENKALVERVWPGLLDAMVGRVFPDDLNRLLNAARSEALSSPGGQGNGSSGAESAADRGPCPSAPPTQHSAGMCRVDFEPDGWALDDVAISGDRISLLRLERMDKGSVWGNVTLLDGRDLRLSFYGEARDRVAFNGEWEPCAPPAESGASGTDGAELPPCQPERPDHDR